MQVLRPGCPGLRHFHVPPYVTARGFPELRPELYLTSEGQQVRARLWWASACIHV